MYKVSINFVSSLDYLTALPFCISINSCSFFTKNHSENSHILPSLLFHFLYSTRAPLKIPHFPYLQWRILLQLSQVIPPLRNSGMISKSGLGNQMELSSFICKKAMSDFSKGSLNIVASYTKIKGLWDELDTLNTKGIRSCACDCGGKEKMVKAQQMKDLFCFVWDLVRPMLQ